MHFEDIGTHTIIDSLLTIVDRLVNPATYGGHGQGIVVSANMIPKGFANVILSSEQLEKLRWHWVERWQDNFPTQAAHAKLGISIRGCCQLFGHPV